MSIQNVGYIPARVTTLLGGNVYPRVDSDISIDISIKR